MRVDKSVIEYYIRRNSKSESAITILTNIVHKALLEETVSLNDVVILNKDINKPTDKDIESMIDSSLDNWPVDQEISF